MTPPTAPEDFVDFYQVLEADRESTTTHLRRRINELYSESMSNRDHRNPNKRRRYEALCELLPYCRIVLLDPDKRARYDRYLLDKEEGKTDLPPFETMMEEIAGSIGPELGTGEKIGLLGVEGDDDYLLNATGEPESAATTRGRRAADRRAQSEAGPAISAPVARAEKGAIASNATTVAPTKEDSVTLTGKRLPKRAGESLMGSLMSVIAFFVIFLIAYVFTKQLSVSVLPAAIIAVVVWIATHRRATPIK
ncbi:MAG TPA: hypothetical protein VF681_03260 [Abditibacteriaceae bacterium]